MPDTFDSCTGGTRGESVNSKLSGDAFINVRYTLGGIIVWLAECHSDSERSTKFVIAMPLPPSLSLSLPPSPLGRSKGRLIRFIVSVQMRPRTKGTMSKANWYVLNYPVPYYTLEFERVFRRARCTLRIFNLHSND